MTSTLLLQLRDEESLARGRIIIKREKNINN